MRREKGDFEMFTCYVLSYDMTLPGVGDVEANVLLSEERRPGPLGG